MAAMERIPILELKNKAGYELPPLVFEIDKTLISRFAAAVGDGSPRWQTEAPPSLIPALGFDRVYELLASSEDIAVLHGATEVEFFRNVSLGDTISMKSKIASARERISGGKTTVFVNVDASYTNQLDEPVATCRQTAIVTSK
ncbi:N-terminal half of MaoC dehydratase [Dehalogenimonas formicexedens]|uniref:N-terminal half of MaoC dehydratase n=1 Tax=Dehalogenimonas formicexedens TaxID=1839801 RepID=A0A1P8F5I2_9CHLR|nr:MaoC family dehydratase N-terminal domain-containing protein [Dehalogenimonas formicexedens]APV43602.1 N-terminal half of MaoC dehydratase [Dehalogenimonas formicexedens]